MNPKHIFQYCQGRLHVTGNSNQMENKSKVAKSYNRKMNMVLSLLLRFAFILELNIGEVIICSVDDDTMILCCYNAIVAIEYNMLN